MKILDLQLLKMVEVMVEGQIYDNLCPDIHYIKKHIKVQSFVVPADSGVTYFNKTLLTVELNICAASLTFIMEYGVSFICSMHDFGSM